MQYTDVLETLAEDVHADAGSEVGPFVVEPHRLARAMWGDDAVELVAAEHMPDVAAMLSESDGHPRIFLREGTPAPVARTLVAAKLAHWLILHCGLAADGDEIERDRADYLGACIVCPRAAFCESVDKHGDDFYALADRFGVPQGLAALRHAEVTTIPVALVRPRRVIKRGRPVDPGEWLPDDTLRAWANGGDDPRMRRRPLTDAPGVVLARVVPV